MSLLFLMMLFGTFRCALHRHQNRLQAKEGADFINAIPRDDSDNEDETYHKKTDNIAENLRKRKIVYYPHVDDLHKEKPPTVYEATCHDWSFQENGVELLSDEEIFGTIRKAYENSVDNSVDELNQLWEKLKAQGVVTKLSKAITDKIGSYVGPEMLDPKFDFRNAAQTRIHQDLQGDSIKVWIPINLPNGSEYPLAFTRNEVNESDNTCTTLKI